MKRAPFSLLSFRVPSLHFRRKSAQTPQSNADNCPSCRSTQLRRTHALRQRVQSVASLHFLPNGKWKDENLPAPLPVQWKCSECGWIGVKDSPEASSPATSSGTTNLRDPSPPPPLPVTPAVPWQQYERLPTPTPPHAVPTEGSPAQSTSSLPAAVVLGNGLPNANSPRRHRTSRSLSPRSAWHKFAGSFGGSAASTPNVNEKGLAGPGGRPEPITEMNPLYQAAEKWHRPPSFIFREINGNGNATGDGQAGGEEKARQVEGRGGRIPKWMYVN